MTTELINIYQISNIYCRSATEMSSTVIAAFATLWQFVNEPLGFMLPGKCGSELSSVSCVLQRWLISLFTYIYF